MTKGEIRGQMGPQFSGLVGGGSLPRRWPLCTQIGSQRQKRWSREPWRIAEYESPESWDASEAIFITEFLAGFLLLHRSGLEPNEKSNILGSIRGEFSTMSVGRALREERSDFQEEDVEV